MARQLLGTALVIGVIGMAAVGAGEDGKSGVYLSPKDYQSSVLTGWGSCDSEEHKLELHNFLNKPYIDVTHGGGSRRYAKSELFGFRSCDGVDYRFVGDREYRILEAKGLYIYSIPRARRGSDYHFSVGPTGPVLRLTLDNLKRELPDNHKFHDSLDQAFKSNSSLTHYDEFHKMFKVNRLLLASEGR